MRVILTYTIGGNKNLGATALTKLLAKHGMVLSPIKLEGVVTNGKRTTWRTTLSNQELKDRIDLIT